MTRGKNTGGDGGEVRHSQCHRFRVFLFLFSPFETEYNSSVRAVMFRSRLKKPVNEVGVTAVVIAQWHGRRQCGKYLCNTCIRLPVYNNGIYRINKTYTYRYYGICLSQARSGSHNNASRPNVELGPALDISRYIDHVGYSM